MEFRFISPELDDSGTGDYAVGEHGSINHVEIGGYSLAHDLDRRIHEKDLEDITFEIHCPDGNEFTEEDIKAPEATSYLEKFPYVYEAIADMLNERGYFGELYSCPQCAAGDGGQEPLVELVFDK